MKPEDVKTEADIHKPKIVNHRADFRWNGQPENTAPAAKYAISAGIVGVECDVHLTQPAPGIEGDTGELILLHDGTMERTTNYPDPAASPESLTLAQIRSARVKANTGAPLIDKDGTERTVKVPTLREFLDAITDYRTENPATESAQNFIVNIEIKKDPMERTTLLAQKVVDEIEYQVKSKGMPRENFQVSSNDMQALKAVREISDDLQLGAILWNPDEQLDVAPENQNWDVTFDQLREFLQQARDLNLDLYSVNCTWQTFTREARKVITEEHLAYPIAWTFREKDPIDYSPGEKEVFLERITDPEHPILYMITDYGETLTRLIQEDELKKRQVLATALQKDLENTREALKEALEERDTISPVIKRVSPTGRTASLSPLSRKSEIPGTPTSLKPWADPDDQIAQQALAERTKIGTQEIDLVTQISTLKGATHSAVTPPPDPAKDARNAEDQARYEKIYELSMGTHAFAKVHGRLRPRAEIEALIKTELMDQGSIRKINETAINAIPAEAAAVVLSHLGQLVTNHIDQSVNQLREEEIITKAELFGKTKDSPMRKPRGRLTYVDDIDEGRTGKTVGAKDEDGNLYVVKMAKPTPAGAKAIRDEVNNFSVVQSREGTIGPEFHRHVVQYGGESKLYDQEGNEYRVTVQETSDGGITTERQEAPDVTMVLEYLGAANEKDLMKYKREMYEAGQMSHADYVGSTHYDLTRILTATEFMGDKGYVFKDLHMGNVMSLIKGIRHPIDPGDPKIIDLGLGAHTTTTPRDVWEQLGITVPAGSINPVRKSYAPDVAQLMELLVMPLLNVPADPLAVDRNTKINPLVDVYTEYMRLMHEKIRLEACRYIQKYACHVPGMMDKEDIYRDFDPELVESVIKEYEWNHELLVPGALMDESIKAKMLELYKDPTEKLSPEEITALHKTIDDRFNKFDAKREKNLRKVRDRLPNAVPVATAIVKFLNTWIGSPGFPLKVQDLDLLIDPIISDDRARQINRDVFLMKMDRDKLKSRYQFSDEKIDEAFRRWPKMKNPHVDRLDPMTGPYFVLQAEDELRKRESRATSGTGSRAGWEVSPVIEERRLKRRESRLSAAHSSPEMSQLGLGLLPPVARAPSQGSEHGSDTGALLGVPDPFRPIFAEGAAQDDAHSSQSEADPIPLSPAKSQHTKKSTTPKRVGDAEVTNLRLQVDNLIGNDILKNAENSARPVVAAHLTSSFSEEILTRIGPIRPSAHDIVGFSVLSPTIERAMRKKEGVAEDVSQLGKIRHLQQQVRAKVISQGIEDFERDISDHVTGKKISDLRPLDSWTNKHGEQTEETDDPLTLQGVKKEVSLMQGELDLAISSVRKEHQEDADKRIKELMGHVSSMLCDDVASKFEAAAREATNEFNGLDSVAEHDASGRPQRKEDKKPSIVVLQDFDPVPELPSAVKLAMAVQADEQLDRNVYHTTDFRPLNEGETNKTLTHEEMQTEAENVMSNFMLSNVKKLADPKDDRPLTKEEYLQEADDLRKSMPGPVKQFLENLERATNGSYIRLKPRFDELTELDEKLQGATQHLWVAYELYAVTEANRRDHGRHASAHRAFQKDLDDINKEEARKDLLDSLSRTGHTDPETQRVINDHHVGPKPRIVDITATGGEIPQGAVGFEKGDGLGNARKLILASREPLASGRGDVTVYTIATKRQVGAERAAMYDADITAQRNARLPPFQLQLPATLANARDRLQNVPQDSNNLDQGMERVGRFGKKVVLTIKGRKDPGRR